MCMIQNFKMKICICRKYMYIMLQVLFDFKMFNPEVMFFLTINIYWIKKILPVISSLPFYIVCHWILNQEIILSFWQLILDQKKPSVRPLSASRVNAKTRIDTDEEASAVLEAMRAENEQASKLKKETPRKLPPTPKQVNNG